jgi:hypothetical protein
MPATLKFIGQAAMDNYFLNYRVGSDFFNLQDFTLRAATTIAEYYQKIYDQQYAMNRADKTDEVVAFPTEILSEQELQVERKENEIFATLLIPTMAFLGDNQTSGIQDVIPVSPFDAQLERSNVSEVWQYKLLPFTNRLFWRLESGKIKFFKKGRGNINIIRVLYIPAVMDIEGNIFEDAQIADGVADMAINLTVAKFKQLSAATIVKELNDGSANKILENETNLVKP